VETSREHGGDRETGIVTEENSGEVPTARVQTPEEIAREFLQSGQVLVDAEPEEPVFTRNWAFVIGLVCVGVVLAGIVAFVLISTRHSHPPTAAVRLHPTTTVPIPVKTVKSTTPSTSTTTSTPLLANSAVLVTVLNASQTDGLAAQTAAGLTADGFTVSTVGTAPNPIASGGPSQILYGPSSLSAAHVLGSSLSGPVSYVASPGLTGTNVTLMVAGPQLTVVSGTTTTTGGVTTTSAP
jgi:LytR cell envelope-related transcriptional attenuator